MLSFALYKVQTNDAFQPRKYIHTVTVERLDAVLKNDYDYKLYLQANVNIC